MTPILEDSMVNISGKKLFRQDRLGRNVKGKGGGLCVYISNTLSARSKMNLALCKCTRDYEVLVVDITKPGLKYMSLICLYRPPDGNIKTCIDYLKTVFQACKSEIWILGDFNVDFLDRSCDSRSKFNTLFTSCGLKQLMHSITRPNKRGGTCIDWVVTNSEFIKDYGVMNDYISDHLSIYVIRKKARECHKYVYRTVRDLSNYDTQVFGTLIANKDWDQVMNSDDIEYIWSELYKGMHDILSIMCPYRRFRQREKITPWLNPTIYKAMRERDAFMSIFRQTGYTLYLEIARRCRNKVNGLIYKAKSEYISMQLNQNSRNPKKFWCIIKGLLNHETDSTVNAKFVDPNTGLEVVAGMEANFLNSYFINIVRNLNIPVREATMLNVYNVDTRFDFDDENMPELEEVIRILVNLAV